jgi:hypothetical protein
MQSHVDECPLCEGPCKPHPFRLPPIHPKYPFLPPEVIAMTQPQPEPEPEVEPKPPSGKRAKRLQEDRMRRPSEDR